MYSFRYLQSRVPSQQTRSTLCKIALPRDYQPWFKFVSQGLFQLVASSYNANTYNCFSITILMRNTRCKIVIICYRTHFDHLFDRSRPDHNRRGYCLSKGRWTSHSFVGISSNRTSSQAASTTTNSRLIGIGHVIEENCKENHVSSIKAIQFIALQ